MQFCRPKAILDVGLVSLPRVRCNEHRLCPRAQQRKISKRTAQKRDGCVVLGAVFGAFYGEPSHDENDEIVDEGFPTTFKDKAAVGVEAFFQLFGGAAVGIYFAQLVRESERNVT